MKKETYVCKASHNYLLSNNCTFFKFVDGILRNWESLCDIRPDCHHHFDASGTSTAMFSQMKLLFGGLVIQLVWYIRKQLFTSVSVKVVEINLAVSRLGKYPPLFTSTSVNNC